MNKQMKTNEERKMNEYETKMKEQRDEIKENLKKKDYVLTVYEDGDYAWGDMSNSKVRRSYAVCSLEEIPEYIEKAKLLGEKIVNDIKIGKKYTFQSIFDKILVKIITKTVIIKNIKKNKNGFLK